MKSSGAELAERTDDDRAPAPVGRARPQFQPSRRRGYGRIAAVVLVVAAAGAIGWARLRPKPVTTAAVVRGSAIDAVYAIATVEAFDRVTVKAKVTGSIVDLKVREGAAVKKGDLLALIDSPALKFELERGKADQWAASQQASAASPQLAVIEAQAKMTEASLKNARDELGRIERLVATSAAAPADLDRARSNVTVLEAQLASQRAQAKALKIDLMAKSSGSSAAVSELTAKLADAEVRSPIEGVVLARYVEPGEVVPPNGPVFKIGDVRRLVLECSVDEADIGRLAVGKKAAVSLYAFPKQVFKGSVFDILPDADRTKKAFLVKVSLDEPPAGLRSGMSGEVNVIVDEHPNALLAPTDAVDVSNGVWVVRDGHVEKRTVQLGVRDMLRTEITGGLSEGDEVVIGGAAELTAGARVKATRGVVEKPAASGSPARGGTSL